MSIEIQDNSQTSTGSCMYERVVRLVMIGYVRYLAGNEIESRVSTSCPRSMAVPPPLPLNSVYTSCWCEENIYLLCQAFLENPSVQEEWRTFVIFISNDNKTVRASLALDSDAAYGTITHLKRPGCSMVPEGIA